MESLSLVPQPTAGTSRINGDKYWYPFRLALKTQNTKIVEIALDSVQKMLAFHILTGSTIVTKIEGATLLIDEIVDYVCACFIGTKTEEAIQLQILKCLLTAVTSPNSEVHGTSLTKATQTCFGIHLLSKNVVNQVTSKASLTQMVNLVFQRMEKLAALDSKKPAEPAVYALHLHFPLFARFLPFKTSILMRPVILQ